MDVLVSLVVIAVLIALLAPALGSAREATRRVACASNLRQVGLGVHMYASDGRGQLPPVWMLDDPRAFRFSPERTLALRLVPDGMVTGGGSSGGSLRMPQDRWDGVGVLFSRSYLDAPRVFFCPSHPGEHTAAAYAEQFAGAPGDIISNFQYRGEGPNGTRDMFALEDEAALAMDGFASPRDLNHEGGANVLRAGLSVGWFRDPGNVLAAAIVAPPGGGGVDDLRDTWDQVDKGETGATRFGGRFKP